MINGSVNVENGKPILPKMGQLRKWRVDECVQVVNRVGLCRRESLYG
jgi:hypothetical protein